MVPFVEVDHLVGQADRGLAVGDDHQRGVGRAGSQARQDARLDLGVDGRRGVVEDQQARPPYQRAGKGDALSLTAGQGRAALPQPGAQPVAERGDEAVGLGVAQRRPHLVVGDVGAQGHVAADGVVEEERGLRHQRDRVGQRPAGQVAQVLAVDRDPPGIGVDQTGHQPGQGALAGGGRTDHGDRAAGLDVEGDALQQGRVGVVGVVEAVDRQACAARGWRGCARRRTPSNRSPRARPGYGGSRPRCAGTPPAASRSRGSGRTRWSGGRRPSPRRRRRWRRWITRDTPTASTTRTPTLGNEASVGSKAARIRPARMLTSRSTLALWRTGRSPRPRGPAS